MVHLIKAQKMMRAGQLILLTKVKIISQKIMQIQINLYMVVKINVVEEWVLAECQDSLRVSKNLTIIQQFGQTFMSIKNQEGN